MGLGTDPDARGACQGRAVRREPPPPRSQRRLGPRALRRERAGRLARAGARRAHGRGARRARGAPPVNSRPLEGVRVVELASFVFVPMAGAILAEWGADVIKVEDPGTGDPMRALKVTGQAGSKVAPAANFQLMNRGKRSVGISVASPEGREVLYRLVETADVFTTNLLPASRAKLEIDV